MPEASKGPFREKSLERLSSPERLDQLTPAFLPVVPPDRFDGKPLKYGFVDGQPVVYSIGVDRHDDGGVPPEDRNGYASRWEPPSRVAEIRAEGLHCGDWLLWPSVGNGF